MQRQKGTRLAQAGKTPIKRIFAEEFNRLKAGRGTDTQRENAYKG